MKKNNSISLVLSGGGARGLAHIGVLKALKEINIPISSIGGCSMGGLIASLFAIGTPISEIEEIARKYSSTREMVKLVDLSPRRKGIIVGQRLRVFLSQFIDERIDFSDTKIPLFMNAVNLSTGNEVVFDQGNLLNGILATTAIPGFISPFVEENNIFADGGVVNNLPVSIMKERTCKPIVAVDVHQTLADFPLSGDLTNPYPKSIFPEFVKEYYLAELIKTRKNTDLQLSQSPPDLLLTPTIDPNVSLFFGFQQIDALILAGVSVTVSNKINLQKLLR